MPLHFLHPKYWLTWLSMGFLWLLSQLPWKLQMMIGSGIGRLMFHLLKRRRVICQKNLGLAFPELSAEDNYRLVKKHFISLGKGVLETGISWWASERSFSKLTRYEGLEHLRKEQETNTGIILLSAHFTSLELSGRLLSAKTKINAVYRPHQNVVIDSVVRNARAKRYGNVIARDNIRSMIKKLKDKQLVWYAQDQNFGHKNSVFAPFFGVEAATNTGTSRISKMGHARVIPVFAFRQDNEGYVLRLLPPLENFPGKNIEDDAKRINLIIESQAREFPEQYLWTHRRYKDRPDGSHRY